MRSRNPTSNAPSCLAKCSHRTLPLEPVNWLDRDARAASQRSDGTNSLHSQQPERGTSRIDETGIALIPGSHVRKPVVALVIRLRPQT